MTYYDYIQDEDDLDIYMQGIRTERPTLIEVRVPKHIVGVIIGSGGSQIKDIQKKSNTSIIFDRKCKYFCGHIW